ncbi:unnamed protein product [Camellia sinensis]
MCVPKVEAIVVGEGMKKVEFRSIYEVPNKYIVSRWRKDLERGYTCIPTTYTNFGSSLHPKLHDNYHNTLDEILELATNDDGKHKVIQLGLMKIKDEVRTVQSSSASNVPCTSTLPPSSTTLPPFHTSPKSPPRINTRKESMTRKVLSPLVARRRGRPCTKRKVSKVDAIVNRLKGKNKKDNPVPPNEPYYYPSMDAIADSMYVPAPVSTIGDDIGSTSHTQAGMLNNITSQTVEHGPLMSEPGNFEPVFESVGVRNFMLYKKPKMENDAAIDDEKQRIDRKGNGEVLFEALIVIK